MHVSFLTPLAGLVGLLAVPALLVLRASDRRSRSLAAALGLRPAGPASPAVPALALALAGILAGLAAAQPVVARSGARTGRTDAEVVLVFDITRSMLASAKLGLPTRFDRERRLAKELRAAFPDVPFGIASLTDRVLPHLFPTTSANVFAATLDHALGIELPPPDRSGSRVTALGALAALATNNFFGDAARRRLAVVFTDGESLAVDAGTLRARFFQARIVPFFVQLWGSDERVFRPGGTAERYRPDPAAGPLLAGLAETLGGRVFAERDGGRLVAATRAVLGSGSTGPQGRELSSLQLAPYLALALVLPLALLLWRRNV